MLQVMFMKKYIPLIRGFIVYFAIQCIAFFGTKLFQGEPHLIHSILDDKIPYLPIFVVFYCLWFIFLFLVPFLLFKKKDYEKLNHLFWALLISIILSNIFFLIYPSTVIRADIPYNNIFDYLVRIIYFFDNPPVNCFPSMHCWFAFLFIFSTFNNKNFTKPAQLFFLISNIAICLSTLFIKQHSVLDLLLAFPSSLIIWVITRYIKIDYLNLVNKKKQN